MNLPTPAWLERRRLRHGAPPRIVAACGITPRAASGPRAGLSLSEIMIALTLTGIVFAAAVPVLSLQSRAIARQSQRTDSQLNARFAMATLERELRAAGIGVLDQQPLLVEGGPRAITFNADLVGNGTVIDPATGLPLPAGSGPGASVTEPAVNLDPDAPAGAVGVMNTTPALTLPATGQTYPGMVYRQAGGVPSRAETISFYFTADADGGRSDEFVLWRRVNLTPPEVVARRLVISGTQRPFRYFTVNALTGVQEEVPAASTPFWHSAAQHGNIITDVGASAIADAVRYVRVQLVSRALDRRTGREMLDTLESNVRLMNAGLLTRTTCGEPPAFSSALAAAATVTPQPQVTLTWSRAIDEAGGERDVERYLIFRRPAGGPADWGSPLMSVSSGQATYLFVDNAVERNTSYVYGVAAQDCSPLNSAVASAAVTVPN